MTYHISCSECHTIAKSEGRSKTKCQDNLRDAGWKIDTRDIIKGDVAYCPSCGEGK